MQEHLEFLVVGEGFHEAGQNFELLAQTGNGTVTAGNRGGEKLCGGKKDARFSIFVYSLND